VTRQAGRSGQRAENPASTQVRSGSRSRLSESNRRPSLRDNTPGSTRLHSSPLTCGIRAIRRTLRRSRRCINFNRTAPRCTPLPRSGWCLLGGQRLAWQQHRSTQLRTSLGAMHQACRVTRSAGSGSSGSTPVLDRTRRCVRWPPMAEEARPPCPQLRAPIQHMRRLRTPSTATPPAPSLGDRVSTEDSMSTMATMYSAGAMLAMMAFLILAVCGQLLAVRVLGGHQLKGDHPRQ